MACDHQMFYVWRERRRRRKRLKAVIVSTVVVRDKANPATLGFTGLFSSVCTAKQRRTRFGIWVSHVSVVGMTEKRLHKACTWTREAARQCYKGRAEALSGSDGEHKHLCATTWSGYCCPLCPRKRYKRIKKLTHPLKYLSAMLSFLTRWAVWPHQVILCAGIKGQNVCWPLALLEDEKGPDPQQNTNSYVRDLKDRLYKAWDLARRIKHEEILQKLSGSFVHRMA